MRRAVELLLLSLVSASLACSRSPRPAPVARGGPASSVAPASKTAPQPPVAALAVDPLEEQERRLAALIARAKDHVVTLEFSADEGTSARRVATGVVVSDDDRGRDVLSVRIAPPPSGAPIMARDASGRRLVAQWRADDPETGLTLLRVDDPAPRRKLLGPLPEPARPPRLGTEVLVIGNPFGLGPSVTRGTVSGLDRRLDLGDRPLGGLIQIDAAFHPGDSGALVINLRGEWLGLVRSGLAPPGRGAEVARDEHLGFALSVRDALWVAGRLRDRRKVDRAYLGIRIALRPSSDGPGAVLDSVLDDTPADRAGLKAGDRVVNFDGRPIRSARDLSDRLDRTLADADTVIDYYRGAQRARCFVRTASRPESEREREPRRDDERARPEATAKADDPRVLKDRIELLERRIAELEREREKAQEAPREARADAGPGR